MIGKFVVKTLDFVTHWYGLSDNLWERVPQYLKSGYGDTYAAAKLPPGERLHRVVEVVVLVVGVVGVLVEMRRNKNKVE